MSRHPHHCSHSGSRDRRGDRSHHHERDTHGSITHICYTPPLPTPNAQLNQWEKQGLSIANNASNFNVNDENDAVGALLRIADNNNVDF